MRLQAGYNPAGLVLLKHQQGIFSGAEVMPSSELINGTAVFINEPYAPYVQTFNKLQGAPIMVLSHLYIMLIR